MTAIEVLTSGVIRPPKEITGRMGTRARDRLECIYGTRQIGLFPLCKTGLTKVIFPKRLRIWTAGKKGTGGGLQAKGQGGYVGIL